MRGTTDTQLDGPWPAVQRGLPLLFDPAAWKGCFAKVDPYSDHWRAELQSEAGKLATRVWADLCKQFPAGTSPRAVARNTWVLLKRADPSLTRLLEVVLVFAVSGQDRIDEVVRGLQAGHVVGEAIPESHWLEVLLGRADIDAQGVGVRGLDAELALVYALAETHRRHLGRATDLVGVLGKYPGVSRRALGRQVREFLTHQTLEPLPTTAIRRLPPRIAVLLGEQPDLKAAVLGVPADVTPKSLRAVQQQWQSSRELRKVARSLIPAIHRRDLPSAELLAQQCLRIGWQRDALAGLEHRLEQAINAPVWPGKARRSDWPSQHAALSKVLRLIAPGVAAVRLLTTDSGAIAARATRSRSHRVTQVLAAADLDVLKHLWDDATQAQLFQAGRFELVSEDYEPSTERDLIALVKHIRKPTAKKRLGEFLEDPLHRQIVLRALQADAASLRHALQALARENPAHVDFLIPELGTAVVRGVLTDRILNQPVFLERAIEHWTQQPSSAKKKKAVIALADGVSAIRQSEAFAALGGKFLVMDPGAARILGRRVGPKRLQQVLPVPEAIASARGDRAPLPPLLHAEAVIAGIAVDDAAASWAAVREEPKFVAVVCGLNWPPVTLASTREQARIGILAASKDWRVLRSIAQVLGAEAFRAGVADVRPLLPAQSRGLAFLELAACLAPTAFSLLARAFGAARFSAAHGCAFDDCYKTYPLPKKAGGNRTITVPPTWLRLLQRTIYEQILRPLGAHEAAHGFVPQRSIVSNATVHVGQAVVVNCDIASCFPSVRWSLVLAALKRDLGQRFAPATISWLVDLGCYRGALPVGAPTSPALLNRVLLRTDQFLAQHAQRRECRYTRYADDLTFSGDDRAVGMLRLAVSTLARIGLTLDTKKTNIYRGGRRQMVTGLVVNTEVSVPRRLRRRMRAAVHAVEQGREPLWHGQLSTVSSLRGRLAFTRAVNPDEANRLIKRLNDAEGE